MPAPAEGLPQRFDLASFLFNAAGRSGRIGYLTGLALAALLVQPLSLLTGGWQVLYGWTVGFLAFVIWCTLASRRLHDLGRAGWWVAALLATAWLALTLAPINAWLGGILGFLALSPQLALLLRPGQPRFNRFGPPIG